MSHDGYFEEDFDEGRKGHGGGHSGGGDSRLNEVERGKQDALNEVDKTYDGMIDQSDKFFQDQIDAAKEWEETQKQNQQAQTDFAIEQVEQQKQQAEKDYTREQAGAYTDWQKQSNQYGAKAEQMAAQGLSRTGYTESSQVSMYNTYQNRVSRAKEAFGVAVQNYNNMITQARLQNNSVLAEIAYRALQQRLELALNGFQYKNSLILDKFNQKNTIDNNYWGRYIDILNQINQEKAFAEQVREFNILNPQDDGSGGGSGSSGGGSGKYTSSGSGGDSIQKGGSSSPSLTELVNAGALTPQQATTIAKSEAINEKWKNDTANKVPGGVKL